MVACIDLSRDAPTDNACHVKRMATTQRNGTWKARMESLNVIKADRTLAIAIGRGLGRTLARLVVCEDPFLNRFVLVAHQGLLTLVKWCFQSVSTVSNARRGVSRTMPALAD
jgi:hypothetical protein